jgi:NAD(P)-dependent dehydrogenase (short-subunit alcohol dehydrogenase family)
MTDLSGKVVVVTGASSGLGREAAVQFAAQGCHVIVAARREGALVETARLCRAAGGNAQHCVTDVTHEEDVARLAELALEHGGRIDVWVNNAGVTLFSPIEEGSFAEHRRVIETNLFGAMFAARAVVPIFRRQRQGTMINVGSILSKIGQPYVPSYVISKFALRGLSEVLRTELAHERDIHVCSIYPYAIDTQHFESGASHMQRQVRAMPPVQSPEKVARAIVDLARRPRYEVHVPRVAAMGLALHHLAPRTVERLLFDSLKRWHFDRRRELDKEGNLFSAGEEPASVHGKRRPRLSTSAFSGWAVSRFVRNEAAAFGRLLRRAKPRGSARPAAPRLAQSHAPPHA